MIIPVSVWSDIACPWCFVGKAHLESAVAQLAPEVELRIRFRAFELDPTPREPSTKSYAERLANKYQRSLAEANEMLATMTRAIAQAGGHADFNRVIAANTFNAHRLIQWAGATDDEGSTDGAQHRITDALMRGYLGSGLNLANDDDMLETVAAQGLDVTAAAGVLSTERYADVVRADEQEAAVHGIRGVPFFAIGADAAIGLSGAQPAEALVEVVRKVQAEVKPPS